MTEPHVSVDARIELMSAVCMAAGAPEYTAAFETPYLRQVRDRLAGLTDHPGLATTRRLRLEHGVSHDAPLLLAVQLDDTLALRAGGAAADSRWSGVDLESYLRELRDVARLIDLDAVIRAQSTYLARVEEQFRGIADARLVEWFAGMFAHRSIECLVAPGMLTGPMSYGLRADNTRFTAVMSLERVDDAGVPHLGDQSRELLAHELAHCYVNPVIAERLPEIEVGFRPAYERVHEEMSRHSYATLDIVLAEAVVRAVTLLYMHDRYGQIAAARSLREQHQLGFSWTDDLARSLDEHRREGPLSDDVIVTAVHEVFSRAPTPP